MRCICEEPIEKSRYSSNSGTGSSKQDFANELLTKEAGLRLQRKPAIPRALPATILIKNLHGIRDWQRFLAPFSGEAA